MTTREPVVQPILVCMSWRGGQRLARCLASIEKSAHHFSRVVISVTGHEDCDDMRLARDLRDRLPGIEVICTGTELPTMEHQAFWIGYLQASGATRSDWVYWLAYDDEVRTRGIDAIVDDRGSWPLIPGTAYFGPWALRHEQPDALWAGDPDELLESWTSFPADGPTRLPVAQWIADQLRQPTYMQMSGSVCRLGSFVSLRDLRPRKRGPMRIEMAVAASPGTSHVEEFPEPVSIIYGRSNSDRASYGRLARREDAHLAAWLVRFSVAEPRQAGTVLGSLARSAGSQARARLGIEQLPEEEWRVRGLVTP